MESINTAFKKHKDDIILLEKNEFDIFYSKKYKYPLLTVETIHSKTGKTENGGKIKRSEIEDPFRVDKELPLKYRHSLKDYQIYMKFGGSLGHNAPAGHHKTNLENYSETFLLSNMCPQEIVFNSSLWVVLETFCFRLKNEKDLTDIKVFTGSIPSKTFSTFDGVKMNVPEYMFKIVICKHKDKPNSLFIGNFLMENKHPTEKIHKIYKHLVSLKHLSNLTNINFFVLFSHYLDFNPTKYTISSLKKVTRVDVKFNPMMSRQMNSALYYGKLIYPNTLEQLNQNWSDSKKYGFDDEFHEVYYKLCKSRIKNLKSIKKKSSKKKSFSKKKTSSKKKSSSKVSPRNSYAKTVKTKKKSSSKK
jgi:DNA/RNA endonuclease G (NUC1)